MQSEILGANINNSKHTKDNIMTREHAKAILPFITAYAEGKQIQQRNNGLDRYVDLSHPTFANDPSTYRIKPEPKLVPMTSDDFPPGMIWIKSGSKIQLVIGFQGDQLLTEAWCSAISVFASDGDHWSTDRKTWNSFMKEVQE